MKVLIRCLPHALFTVAGLLLAWCFVARLESHWFQQAENRQLEQLVAARKARAISADLLPGADLVPAASIPDIRGLIGRIEIPRLSISTMVVEGTSGAILRHAAGHIAGTAKPGESGNTAISAHRDTFFRPLRNVRVGDLITITTPNGDYSYYVVSTRITNPFDTAVLDPRPAETLTLITCYPFYFVGAAPDRFIVSAERAQ